MKRNNILPLCFAIVLSVAMSCNNKEKIMEISSETVCIEGLHAPWDNLHDNTIVTLSTDEDSLYCNYIVNDTTLTLCENFTGEDDVNYEDRVEIFFSVDENMGTYYCAEVDPCGRIMDYSAHSYRLFNYGWNFKTMKSVSACDSEGYYVRLSVAKDELREIGLKLEDGLYIGIFRADFHKDSPENWLSSINLECEKPDFHIPSHLFPVKIL